MTHWWKGFIEASPNFGSWHWYHCRETPWPWRDSHYWRRIRTVTGRQDEGRMRLMMVKKRGFYLVNALGSNKDDHRKMQILYFSDWIDFTRGQWLTSASFLHPCDISRRASAERGAIPKLQILNSWLTCRNSTSQGAAHIPSAGQLHSCVANLLTNKCDSRIDQLHYSSLPQ